MARVGVTAAWLRQMPGALRCLPLEISHGARTTASYHVCMMRLPNEENFSLDGEQTMVAIRYRMKRR